MSDSKTPLILTIDDEGPVRGSIIAYLADAGMRDIGTSSGKEGLEVFRREQPDLVLLDLRLPNMGGLEVLKSLRQEAPDAAVIVVSGKGLMSDAIEALRLGAWDYLTKPIQGLAVLGQKCPPFA